MSAKPARVKGTLFVLFVLLIVFLTISHFSKTSQQNKGASNTAAPAPSNPAPSKPPAPKKRIPYKIIDKWNAATPIERQSGRTGIGMRIVISPKYVNVEYMTALGETLKKDTRDYDFVYIQVHTSKKSALIQKRLTEATEAEGNYLGKHLVGSYTKNTYTGFHEFDIFLKGTDDTSAENNKVIEY